MAILINDNYEVNVGKPIDSKYLNIDWLITNHGIRKKRIRPVSWRHPLRAGIGLLYFQPHIRLLNAGHCRIYRTCKKHCKRCHKRDAGAWPDRKNKVNRPRNNVPVEHGTRRSEIAPGF